MENLNLNPESVVVGWIYGTYEVPEHLSEMVESYRGYAEVRGECVSYPKHYDSMMNKMFEVLCEEVSNS